MYLDKLKTIYLHPHSTKYLLTNQIIIYLIFQILWITCSSMKPKEVTERANRILEYIYFIIKCTTGTMSWIYSYHVYFS